MLKLWIRVARWFILKQKIPFWVIFVMEDVGMFYGHSVYFTANW
jgi:hypothetical protein